MQVKGAGVRERNTLPTTKRNFLIGFEAVNMMNRKIARAELLFRASRIARGAESAKRKGRRKKRRGKREEEE